MAFATETYGDWTVRVDRDEKIIIDPEVGKAIEVFLERYREVAMAQYTRDYEVPTFAMRELGIPSPVLRLDMPPAPDEFNGTYEVEANTAGLGIAHNMGVSVVPAIVKMLAELGISRLGLGTASQRSEQAVDHDVFAYALMEHGICVTRVDPSIPGVADPLPLWLRAGQEDIDRGTLPLENLQRSLLLHNHGGGHKGYLEELDEGTMRVSRLDSPGQPFVLFPNGFVLKPYGGWGTRNMNIFCPHQPHKKRGYTRKRMTESIERIMKTRNGDNWLIQPYRPPEVHETEDGLRFRIWRIYAVWNGSRYEVVGGFWAQRNTVKVHGADDCEWGLVDVA